MSQDLKGQTVHAVAWSFGGQALKQAVSFAIAVVLARLLVPEHFGLIAMVTAFTRFANMFMNLGLSLAIVQRKEVGQEDLSTIFWVNALIAVALTAVFFFGAPLLAAFYDQPDIAPLTRALSFSFVIEGAGIVQRALLAKRIDFKTQTLINAAGVAVAGSVGVALALSGFGVWSLVWHLLTGSFVTVGLLWLFGGWRPSPVFSLASIRKVMGFSLGMMGDKLLTSFFDQADKMLLGKFATARLLGLYARGESLMQYPTRFFSHALPMVLVSVMSKVQDDPPKLRRFYGKTLSFSSLALFPCLVLLLLFAEDVIALLLGAKWLEAAPFLQLFCLIGFAQPITTVARNSLIALGDAGALLRMETVKKTLLLSGMGIGLVWGVYGLLIARAGLTLLYAAVEARISSRRIGFHFWSAENPLGRIALACLAMAGAGLALDFVALADSRWLDAPLKMALAGVVYAGAVRLLARDLMDEALALLRDKWHKTRRTA